MDCTFRKLQHFSVLALQNAVCALANPRHPPKRFGSAQTWWNRANPRTLWSLAAAGVWTLMTAQAQMDEG